MVWWKGIIKAILPKAIQGDILQLVHISKSFLMFPVLKLLRKDNIVKAKKSMNSILNQGLEKDGGGQWNHLKGSVANYGGYFTILV